MKQKCRIFISCLVVLWAQASSQEMDSIQIILDNCRDQSRITKYYDPSYVRLDYPMGDVPMDWGVCTDVVVRAFRAGGIDLQELIHRDMKANFAQYPDNWDLKKPDPNIDHRRVPNISNYMRRMGKEIRTSKTEKDYEPGDIVIWKLPNNLDHIGIVSDKVVEGSQRYCIYHNIGQGTRLEDILMKFRITGHFRYFNSN
ncbi:MAG: DUF1287 domain-containing protein [Chitinivibrionales bacterium]|nr:DUF1287 domain-containing protein [Chitinivibrionales bacterium]